ncbi:4-hydroxy-tetrahydrodipicolinate synthase [Lactobacillus sp. S2-2]|uniref:4-hydroxy-tetrahydrodipicolinate synthase n=1 Tax=Lactobacillus sp. S2-2 TaxID=2692917 RepID=UPI001EFF755B|nr:4-hydroxy-tetrahydrodipicolinate synthase [Lactobacillus sp. S2-2]MCF6514925.1 4-hydroxy-tetrahydrodipicolinate synthase [Lactobacillus sp. S2-2]
MNNKFDNVDLMTAIITPFDKDNQINFKELNRLAEHLMQDGCNGFVIGGTTGETPTLTHDEKIELYTKFAAFIDGRVPVIAGTGSNNTKETTQFTKEVSKIDGIDAALVVVPYYNKPSQRGMVAHFETVAASSNIPLFIYNVPSRTGIAMEDETIIKLSKNQNILGVKQCMDLASFQNIVENTSNDFFVYSGEDPQALFAKMVGGKGIISVASHIYTKQMRNMYDALDQGDLNIAGYLSRYLTPKMNALFMYPSPSPVKALLNDQGYQVGDCRLPIVSLNEAEKIQLMNKIID